MQNILLKIAILFLIGPLSAQAFILPTRVILNKTSENAGNGLYAIEQEVQFSNGNQTIQLKETWLIDSEHSMRLTVTGTKELQNSLKMQFVYAGGNRYRLVGSTLKNEKTSEEFLEKYLNFRTGEDLANSLAHQQIIPAGSYSKKSTAKTGAEFKYEAEPWVRYSRVGGVPNYALGTVSPVEQEKTNPGVWIEQDQFVIRKLRLPTQVEMTADTYNQFAKGLYYPRNRTVRWGNNTVNIQVTSITARPKTVAHLLQPSSLDLPLKSEGLDKLPAKDAIIEFYSRFR